MLLYNYDSKTIKNHGEPMTVHLMVIDIFYIPRSIWIEKSVIGSQLLLQILPSINIIKEMSALFSTRILTLYL